MNKLECGVPTRRDVSAQKQKGIHVKILSRRHVMLLPDEFYWMTSH